MRARLYRQLIVTALAAALVPVGMLIGLQPAEAQAGTCESWSGAQPPSPGTSDNTLFSTTVLSPCDAWAVGFAFSGGADQTLIEHWNGSAWKIVPSPDPGSANNSLASVRAVSATNIWAVGSFSDGTVSEALILHWDGHSWGQFENPDPGSTANELSGVRAVSASDVWAVGSFGNGTAHQASSCTGTVPDGSRWPAPTPAPATTCLAWPPARPATHGQLARSTVPFAWPWPFTAAERAGPGRAHQDHALRLSPGMARSPVVIRAVITPRFQL